MREGVRVLEGSWVELRPLALPLRTAVFVEEQGVPPELEEDEEDPLAHHVVAQDRTGRVLGTGRLTTDGHIGRLAVAADVRSQGIGAMLLGRLTEIGGRHRHRALVLNAQLHALNFYERAGWKAEGTVFEDAGIPHRRMRLVLR